MKASNVCTQLQAPCRTIKTIQSGTGVGTAFSAVAPFLTAGRRPWIECVDGTSMKVDRSILRKLICPTSWFEPRIFRLRPCDFPYRPRTSALNC